MKLKVIFFFLFSIIINSQSLYNKQLYGYNGKIKHLTSYLYENQDFTKKIDSTSFKSKTISLFSEQGELIETKRDIKSSNQIYTFKSKYISNKDEVLQLRYDIENKLTDSISYTKINKNFWKIYGKNVGSQIITFGEQVLDNFGRDLSSKYTDYENKKVIETFSYENILENNLIVKTVTYLNNQEIVEFYEYSNFDENSNPKKIIIFGSDKKKVKKIIIREFTYY